MRLLSKVNKDTLKRGHLYTYQKEDRHYFYIDGAWYSEKKFVHIDSAMYDIIRFSLCTHDSRSSYKSNLSERPDWCTCQSCLYGTHKLAEVIIKLLLEDKHDCA